MIQNELKQAIERHFAAGAAAANDPAAKEAFLSLRAALEAGEARAAEPDPSSPTGWRVNAWVKQGILLGFRVGVLQAIAERRSFVCRQGHFPDRGALARKMECALFREVRPFARARMWRGA